MHLIIISHFGMSTYSKIDPESTFEPRGTPWPSRSLVWSEFWCDLSFDSECLQVVENRSRGQEKHLPHQIYAFKAYLDFLGCPRTQNLAQNSLFGCWSIVTLILIRVKWVLTLRASNLSRLVQGAEQGIFPTKYMSPLHIWDFWYACFWPWTHFWACRSSVTLKILVWREF